MTDTDELVTLRAQNEALHDQVRQLVRLDRQLFQSQHEIDRQLQRIHRVNRFALDAAATFGVAEILHLALLAILDSTTLEQGVAFHHTDDDVLVPVASAALPGLEAPEPARQGERIPADAPQIIHIFRRGALPEPRLAPFVLAFERVFPPADPTNNGLFLYLPAPAMQDRALGALLIFKSDPSVISPHDRLPTNADAPFFELFAGHVGAALQAATLSNELERRVARRTAELKHAQDQLVQAEKMAAVGTLVAGLSHELNNPITVILGFAQGLLRQTPGPSPQRSGLEAIERQARRCARLVTALLEFSHHEPLVQDPCALGGLLERVVQIARPRARLGEVTIELDLDPDDLPETLVCVGQLESALLSVVHNAIDASPPGLTVVARLRATPRGDRTGFLIELTDRGEGISAERLRRVFDPFYTTRPVGQGTGLGLSLARKIVESHDGTIDVHSTLGEGTTVAIWLPWRKPNEAAKPTA